MNLNNNKLNDLEQRIYNKLTKLIKEDENIKITEAAKLCNVSSSKISKLCKKLEFDNYKQFKHFIKHGELVQSNHSISDELYRLNLYIKNFDKKKASLLARKILKSNRIILTGTGPSLIAIEYFAYRLRLNSHKDIITTSEDFYVLKNLSKNSLVIIYTATGLFKSYENVINKCIETNTNYIIILEENNDIPYLKNKEVLYLTNSSQKQKNFPYEKTRTIWFIFIEEVVSLLNKKDKK